MRRMPRRVWHAVHMSSFALFITATIHGFTAGADNKSIIVQWAALTGSLLVLVLVLCRVLSRNQIGSAVDGDRHDRIRRRVAAE